MLIDWFTVCAQILNLLILVWLMKRFLYKPILAAVTARENLIAAELAAAAKKKDEADKEHEEFQHKNEAFDKEHAQLVSKATDEANAERKRLLDDAHKAVDALSVKHLQSLRTEALSLNGAIAQKASKQVFDIVRLVLKDLATTTLEERMGEVFDRRLGELDGNNKEILGKALKASREPATLRSTFALPAEQRAAIQNALNKAFQTEVRIQFTTAPELISGIELSANGQKLSWTISDYLASMEKGVNELLSSKAQPQTNPTAKGKGNEQSA